MAVIVAVIFKEALGRLRYTECCRLNVCPPKSYAELLMPDVVVLGGGALGGDECRCLMSESHALVKGARVNGCLITVSSSRENVFHAGAGATEHTGAPWLQRLCSTVENILETWVFTPNL